MRLRLVGIRDDCFVVFCSCFFGVFALLMGFIDIYLHSYVAIALLL